MTESAAASQLDDLPAALEASLAGRLRSWESEDLAGRLQRRDFRLWTERPEPEVVQRLGWLDLPRTMGRRLPEIGRLVEDVRSAGIRRVVLLGMGGSSLAPEVFQRTFGPAAGHPDLEVLDSTHPAAVAAALDRLAAGPALVVVSSKSGTTVETLSLFRAFRERLARAGGEPGRWLAAITDPGTPLERLGRELRFRAVVRAPENVGGRYSALSPFGLLPAALLGIDAAGLLRSAEAMLEASAAGGPALRLGAVLGEAALAGRDKLTLFTSGGLASFPDWLEQLVAESTGKGGRGIVPVAEEAPGEPGSYGGDRIFVSVLLDGDEEVEAIERGLDRLRRAGHPTVRIRLRGRLDLGGEMMRWELATAAAGSLLGVQPFDQPDVEQAKLLAARAMRGEASAESAAAPEPLEVSSNALPGALADWLGEAPAGGYLGVQAFLAPEAPTAAALRRLARTLGARTGLAVTTGFGPRYLHSTGQLHKGGPAGGRFLQLLDRPAADLPVPGESYTFGELIRAQATGDAEALASRGRPPLRLQLGHDPRAGLETLLQALD